MSHARVKPDDWAVNEMLTSFQMNQLDTKVSQCLDKRAGQTDTLEGAITMNTGTITLAGATSRVRANASGALIEASASGAKIAATANGATIEANAAGAKIKTTTGGRLEHADDDYPTLAVGHAGRTLVRHLPVGKLLGMSVAVSDPGNEGMDTLQPFSASHFEVLSAGFVGQFKSVDTATNTMARLIVFSLDELLRDGGTLTQLSMIAQKSGAVHSALPAFMPRIRVQRIYLGDTNFTRTALHSSGATVLDGSATVVELSQEHSIVATCDQNNTIDKSLYTYQLLVWNEGGTNALSGYTFWDIKLTQTITDLRPH